MNKSLMLAGLAVLFSVFFLAGCVTASPSAEPAPAPSPEPAPPPPLDYDAVISRSLISTGNNVRLKAAIARARAGREVNIAYIGGSVTEGAGATKADKNYVSLSAAAFKDMFGKGHALNASMSGTPSTLGVIRYNRDVVQRLGADPDIVIIEFAVNDGDDMTGGAAYESLVRDILKAGNSPAVILLFAVFRSRWNLQDRYIPMGKAYGLPMISIKNAVVPALQSKALTNKQFFADEYHPTDYGHKLMADCLAYYFKTADGETADKTDIRIPAEPVLGDQYQGMIMIDSAHIPQGVTVTPGSFSDKDTALGTFMYDPKRRTFPDNWYKKDTAGNDPFTMTLVCKNLLFVYKSSGAFGTAEVSIDGKVVKTVKAGTGGAWNNPVTVLLLDEARAARHTVSVKMTEDTAARHFSILAFGFTR